MSRDDSEETIGQDRVDHEAVNQQSTNPESANDEPVHQELSNQEIFHQMVLNQEPLNQHPQNQDMISQYAVSLGQVNDENPDPDALDEETQKAVDEASELTKDNPEVFPVYIEFLCRGTVNAVTLFHSDDPSRRTTAGIFNAIAFAAKHGLSEFQDRLMTAQILTDEPLLIPMWAEYYAKVERGNIFRDYIAQVIAYELGVFGGPNKEIDRYEVAGILTGYIQLHGHTQPNGGILPNGDIFSNRDSFPDGNVMPNRGVFPNGGILPNRDVFPNRGTSHNVFLFHNGNDFPYGNFVLHYSSALTNGGNQPNGLPHLNGDTQPNGHPFTNGHIHLNGDADFTSDLQLLDDVLDYMKPIPGNTPTHPNIAPVCFYHLHPPGADCPDTAYPMSEWIM